MRITNKTIGAALLLLLAFAGVIAWWASASSRPPQIITFTSGQRYRFAGVTYGTNHSQPLLLAKLINRLPKSTGDYLRAHFGTRWNLMPPVHTDEPTLAVWFELVGTNAGAPKDRPSYSAVAALSTDPGIPSGTREFNKSAPGWIWFEFTNWPRRTRLLQCQMDEVGILDNPSMLTMEYISKWVGAVTIRNPRRARDVQRQSESLPTDKSAGDLRVRLERLATEPDSSPEDGPLMTTFRLEINSPHTNDTWEVDEAELRDATGNRFYLPSNDYRKIMYSHKANEIDNRLPFAIWPDEPAVLLRRG